MANHIPLNDAIAVALSKLIDDSAPGVERRDPSHDDITFAIEQCGLTQADPKQRGNPVGKAKRVRQTLVWSISNELEAGARFADQLISIVRGHGGFRSGSANFCGLEAIANLTDALGAAGWDLGPDGVLRERGLRATGHARTKALLDVAERLSVGSSRDPQVPGSTRDLLEETASHLIELIFGVADSGEVLPIVLPQAFAALRFALPGDAVSTDEPASKALERAAFQTALAVSALRDPRGGKDRPWKAGLNPGQIDVAARSMGNVAQLMLGAAPIRS
ncbi:hypothetical protein [Luteibacter sp. 9135]|uniref:hypothetical protein n=1 Tax=Luteibacter sp. 9135 TaxID=1500893 RepID=UPI000569471D|nr:hypothetical protein [Luteibacter sp. 9135]